DRSCRQTQDRHHRLAGRNIFRRKSVIYFDIHRCKGFLMISAQTSEPPLQASNHQGPADRRMIITPSSRAAATFLFGDKMRKHFFVFLLAISLLVQGSVFAQTVKIGGDERKAAETIQADKLSNWLHFIASDAMGGRNTPSAGLDITAEFIKMNLDNWGFKPAGDNGTFFQEMKLVSDVPDPANTSVEIGGQSYELNNDFFRSE